MSIQEKYDDAYKNAKNLKGGDQRDQLDVRDTSSFIHWQNIRANVCVLQLYGWAKVASGADFAEAKKPGTFDFVVRLPVFLLHYTNTFDSILVCNLWAIQELTLCQGKEKYKAWEKVVKEGLTSEQAKEEYVKRFEELKNKHGLKAQM